MRPPLVLATLAALPACSAAAPPPAASPPPHPRLAAPPPDAALPPDADVPDEVAAAPAWVFRYSTPTRAETWTLRHAGGHALVIVESASGPMRYHGAATDDGTTLAVDVTTGTAKIALACKHATRKVSPKCNDAKARPQPVLDCYVAGFDQPMPFAPSPGLEYVADPTCTGYRLVAP
jgi:hypothetical protein